MHPHDWNEKASRLPEIFADRLEGETYTEITTHRDAGELAQALERLVDALIAEQVKVTSKEQAELAVLAATNIKLPVEKLNELNVSQQP